MYLLVEMLLSRYSAASFFKASFFKDSLTKIFLVEGASIPICLAKKRGVRITVPKDVAPAQDRTYLPLN